VKIALVVIAAIVAFWFVLIPLFERFAPASVVRAYQRLTMPMFKPAYGIVPRTAIIETTGRRTGRARRVCVAARRQGNEVWLVAGIGRNANYVRNIEADPAVRIRIGGRWRDGHAVICPEDDARKRRYNVSVWNGIFLAIAGGDGLSIRIDLDR
jgi:deazaflavin-dependent oxidoreductase (nitroreductase family)